MEQFACFIAAFFDIPGFGSMPWGKRLKLYNKHYGYHFSKDRTLRRWCSQLIERGVVAKAGYSTQWRTYFDGSKKKREPVVSEEEKERMRLYFQRRSVIFKEKYIPELEKGLPPKEARTAAWTETYKTLWAEFDCCYYYCKNFTLTAFSYNDVNLQEIYELVCEIAAAAPAEKVPIAEAPQSKEFVF